MDPFLFNGSNLAYIGDAYLELCVRNRLLSKGITKSKELRKVSIRYVSADAHQKIYYGLMNQFTEEEKQIFLRGRNSTSRSHRQNVDKAAYQISTGLEAVIGYLYLMHNEARLTELMEMIFEEVEKE